MEIGYLGRFSRHTETSLDLNAVPFFIADLSHKSNQTFAQAYDQVATQLRAGLNPLERYTATLVRKQYRAWSYGTACDHRRV